MVFSSPIFLFYFLPSLIALYFCAPSRFKNALLLCASLLFYAWGEGLYLLIMLASIGLNYVFGRLIEAYRSARWPIYIGVVANLSLLLSFKYANFAAENLNYLLSHVGLSEFNWAPVHLPLGISFFTFQAISYLVDIHRREISAQKNLVSLGLYISLFPQLIAGPIVRYTTIAAQIYSRRVSLELFASGAERFVFGLAKKMLIANPLGLVVDTIFDVPVSEIPSYIAWFGILCYALQIYFDFSGYSDMAIGLGRMFGFKFLENFNHPYIARSLQDFWRRWHISLSTWFRDYLYIPLGGNRLSSWRTYVNLFTVFLLCGLWHGASWNFVIWGAIHGAFLAVERAGLNSLLERLWTPIKHVYLLLVVLVSWVFFRAETLPEAVAYVQAMFANSVTIAVPFDVLETLGLQALLALVFGVLLSVPNPYRKMMLEARSASPSIGRAMLLTLHFWLLFGLLLLSIMSLAANTHNPFIYFRF